jgi:hypothetical protein
MRQVRIAQNEEAYRVATAYVVSDGRVPTGWNEWARAYPNLQVLLSKDSAATVDQFRVGTEPESATLGRLYMVDPMGNLMMRYEPDGDPEGVLKDLERLLKVSPLAK